MIEAENNPLKVKYRNYYVYKGFETIIIKIKVQDRYIQKKLQVTNCPTRDRKN